MQLYRFTFFCLLAAFQVCLLHACKDGLPEVACQSLKTTGKCELDEVKGLCPLTCGICGTSPGSTPFPTPAVTVPSWCVNQLPDSDCEGLKATGKCLLSVVKGLCPIQCHACQEFKPTGPPPPKKECKNQGPQILCDVLQSTGRCVYRDIKAMCPVDCDACDAGNSTTDATEVDLPTLGPNDPCKDQLPGFLCLDLKVQNKCDSCVIQALCPEQCDTCAGVNYTCLPLTTTTPAPTTTEKPCVDKSPHCATFMAACNTDPLVTSLCEKTCGVCVPKTTPAPRACQVCGQQGGAPCSPLELMDPSRAPTQCPAGEQYCMNDVSTDENGKTNIVKRCADHKSCMNDWYKSSSDMSSCVDWDPMDAGSSNLDCHFCCEGDNCNKGMKPDIETLFKP